MKIQNTYNQRVSQRSGCSMCKNGTLCRCGYANLASVLLEKDLGR